MKIQHTKIMQREGDLYIVEMLIADAAEPEEGQEMIRFVSHVQVREKGRSPFYAELQRAALVGVRDILDQQKQGIAQSASGQK